MFASETSGVAAAVDGRASGIRPTSVPRGPRSRRRLRVAVVGGGIGGLFAANALRCEGFDVVLYEQAPVLTEVGAGVQLTPNSVRLLERLGFGEAVWRVGCPLNADRSRYLRFDRTPIGPVTTTDSSGWNAVMGIHRADVVEFLAGGLPEGVIHTDHRCVGFEQDANTAALVFEGGGVAEADVVVGADGIHSELAGYVGEPSRPIYSGSVSYRGLVKSAAAPDWPNDAHLVWMGENKHFLVFPVRGGELLNYVGFVQSDEGLAESWSAPGDVAVLEREFSGWDPMLAQLIGQIDRIFGWGLYDRLPRQRWTAGRLTLLGDAAHPMLPHVGQGANQAMEDGAALAFLLARIDRPTEALTAYERLRRERTAEVQHRSRAQGRRYDSQYDDLAVRDAEIAASRQFRYWVYDYDVIAEANQLLATVTN